MRHAKRLLLSLLIGFGLVSALCMIINSLRLAAIQLMEIPYGLIGAASLALIVSLVLFGVETVNDQSDKT